MKRLRNVRLNNRADTQKRKKINRKADNYQNVETADEQQKQRMNKPISN